MNYNANTGLATIVGIWPSIARGIKVRRIDWPLDAYLILSDQDELMFCRALGKPRPFTVRGADFRDQAWDEVREYVPGQNAHVEGADFEGVPV